mmetsp:Transcript_12368/g.21136  ORF Transcript_12368/g.21136 Transcript_12368/m.21136 type:complete len:457 (+) Transcript_12368:167-1537(+)|eukprot:CAMPEP_0184699806 /NCGR_PEP_ID=MMETSP0313-20130426/5927_1 /TAXON_ID=2792 /ORGANISM="Porphyridium aerugineum, Strain SAG 1380-2" /LENGTH=456 /DNA_ID=CAMNT_0027158931 /DNA_START=143 /DNA_END=1513 /DNA_ORIENTATION=+
MELDAFYVPSAGSESSKKDQPDSLSFVHNGRLVRCGIGASQDCLDKIVAEGTHPKSWSVKDKWNLLIVAQENLRVSYHGPGKTDIDAAAIRADHPIPIRDCAVFYYEVEIMNAGQSGYIGIGFCASHVNLNRLPGWERNSFGYHGDDGHAFRDSGTGIAYGPPYTTGDVVGCCWNMIDETVFFTKNGIALGTAFSNVRGQFFPTVGLRTQGEAIEANFGQDEVKKPFRFDIEGYVRETRRKVIDNILKESHLASYSDLVTETVLNYMLHHGFAASAELFAQATGRLDRIKPEAFAALRRQEICKLVLAGDIQGAINSASELEPQMFEADSSILFELKCQKFVEMVRQKVPLSELVEFGRIELAPFRGKNDQFDTKLREVFSLLAYPDPFDSPVSSLLKVERREPVSAALNGALLSAQKKPRCSALQRIIAQVITCQSETAHRNVGPACLISASDFL